MEVFNKIAIANRGEVAVRIIRACQELGIETVLLHSEVDVNSIAYRMADETVCIGPAVTAESYLNIEANVQGAKSMGADAVHPGFGFLSENADFAKAVEDAGMVFIGPSPESIQLFGDKISAKKLVEKAGGPVIPGYQGEDQSLHRLLKEVEAIGYPCIVKAAAGGGGRGLKVIRKKEEAKEAIASAQREGLSAFGSDQVFLEKYLDQAKHIEMQIFGDAGGTIYCLGERECSIQRRHQKIIEEALSPALDEMLRQEMMDVAKKIATAAKYKGAGTIEFLLQKQEFFFLEMNTRLQVEHPVTEFVCGVDLVKAQILTAQGLSLGWQQEFTFHGHAIECRLYAEDPYQMGLPSTGRLGSCMWPHGPGRRFEVGFAPGDEITSFYDSMIAKVIVWDETRPRAIKKMRETLKQTVVFGVKTNIPFLLKILEHPEFVSGEMTTKFIESHFAKALKAPGVTDDVQKIIEDLYQKTGDSKVTEANTKMKEPNPFESSWERS
ncbi:MAG: ATP-grasp domain-containing protein [Bdellovibrionales bacterium]|nr:ATP-grasp domain-containing protein [Bdellovibrionales bacterium]